MKHKLLITLLCMNFITSAKEIAITFDDSPRFAKGYFDGPTRAKKLIETLKNHNVGQVVFYSVSKRLNEEGIKRLQSYSDAGHIIANHTHSHPDFNKLSLKEYAKDFSIADTLLSQFETFKKLFRFPYLREGDTTGKRDGMRTLLKEKGYINAYITLNNYDWYIETLFQQAVKDKKILDFRAMRRFYVDVLMESIEYYDQMAITHLGRSPKHVLLLHEMDISALFIGDLVDELRKKGWKIITTDEAYTDPISQYSSEKILRFNPGRIGEIAKKNNQKKGLWHETLDEEYLKKRFEREVLNTSQISKQFK
ncbi:MAG: polysaccharide deacetylase family protein [Proteobacteria bacterium]|nr:polysaccharide deacetylase family protein [Pseudomonadota bacterium]